MIDVKKIPHQKPDEQIVMYLRRHWLILVRVVIVYLFLSLLPVIFWLATATRETMILEDNNIFQIALLYTLLYYLILWAFFYRSWLDYYLDYWIVTNYRIINTEHQGLFNWVVAEHMLSKIQDVSAHQKGILAGFFDFGEVHVQTAAEESKFNMLQVPKPRACAQAVHQLIERETKKEKQDKK
jgi:hypothetical protein